MLKYFRNYSLRKMWLLKRIAGPFSEHPSGVNVLTGGKNCRSLQESTFILLFHHSDIDRTGKHPFLVRSKILGLLISPLTADAKYSRHNRRKLMQPIQIYLS